MLMRFPLLASLIGSAIAATPAQWRSQSIYFMLTDRFARTDGSTTASCDTKYGVGCELLFRPRLMAKSFLEILRRDLEGHWEPGITTLLSYRRDKTDYIIAGLYPGNGIHGHLDYSHHCSIGGKHCRWICLPWVLAAGHVSSMWHPSHYTSLLIISQLWPQFRIWHGWWSQLPHFCSARSRHVSDGRCRCQSYGLSPYVKYKSSRNTLIWFHGRDIPALGTQLTTVFSIPLTLRSTSILTVKSPTIATRQMFRIVGSATRPFPYLI